MRRQILASGLALGLAAFGFQANATTASHDAVKLRGAAPAAAAASGSKVAARVDGQDITEKQIDAELAGVQIPQGPDGLAQARRQALKVIVARKLLAKAAHDQGIDKTAEFALRKQIAVEQLLAQGLEAKLVKEVPAPTAEGIDLYIKTNPGLFAERKVFDLDSVRFAPPASSTIVKDLQPLNTMAEVEAKLRAENIQFQNVNDTLDSVGNDPKTIAQLAALPAGSVFILPLKGGVVSVNVITKTRVVPIQGADAKRYAGELILQQRRRDAVQRSFSEIVSRAEASHEVVYDKAYQPPAAKP